MQLSDKGAKLIKAFESCERKSRTQVGHFDAYRCPATVVTIGWGTTKHDGKGLNMGTTWSQPKCDQAFVDDMKSYGQEVERLVTVPLKQHQFDALVSFTYNCGVGALRGSTLLRKVNKGDFDGAALEFHRWNRANGQVLRGLVRRRASEALLFQNIDDLDFDGKPDEMPQRVARAPGC